MTPKQLPQFDAAIASFRSFIATQVHCDHIRWIFREDIVKLSGQSYIRLPLADSEKLVEQRYAKGAERGLGVNLHAYVASVR